MYQIGQFRKSQMDSYSTPLQMTMGQQETTISSEGEVIFYNICGNLMGDNIVNNQNSYYLRFGVQQRTDSEQRFYLKLRNVTEIEDNEQLLEEFIVPTRVSIIYFELVFTPNSTYNQILWELQRTILDYQMINTNNNHYGRVMNIEIENFTRLIDVITTLKNTYPNMNYLSKIGIQGPPSMLMCINGEQIRIGKSGIYEINNGIIKITSISFVPKQSNLSSNQTDYFIMDFEY